MILPAWGILMGFEHTPGTIRVDLVEFSSDRNVDQARNTGKDFIRRFDRVEIEAECLGADFSCESILLVVYEFFSLAIVCWEARVMECTVICLRVGEIEGTKCEQVNKREDK